jgi:hypothetical protein
MTSTTRRVATTVRLIGGPTLVIEVGGLRHLAGEVTGFALSGVDIPTIYLSGGNASIDVVEEVARRCAPIDIAVLSAGAARTPPPAAGPRGR